MWQRLDPGCGDGVDVSLDAVASVITIAVHGTWSRRLRRDFYEALDKCLAEQPRTLLIDTNDLDDAGADSVSTWLHVHRKAARMQPPVHALLHVPASTRLAGRLHRVGATRTMHVFGDLAEARIMATRRMPASGRLELGLTPDDTGPARARAVVTEACEAWRLPDIQDRSRLVVSELVANAVEHAGTPIMVVISRLGAGVHTIVRDDDPRLPRLGHAEFPVPLTTGRGNGLLAVQATATLWGALPSGSGKVVWATIKPWRRRR